MDAANSLAREEGLGQVPCYGWISELRQLPVLFMHRGQQVQDLHALLDKKIPPCIHSALDVTYPPPSPSLVLYERVVMLGYIKWDVHLCIVAIRQGLYKPHKLATCCMCGATVTPRHYTPDCPLLDFFRVAITCFAYFRLCTVLVYQLCITIVYSHFLWKLFVWHCDWPFRHRRSIGVPKCLSGVYG